MGPGLMVRIVALDPICDSTLPEIPAVVRVGTEWLVVPFARVLGYKNYYPGFRYIPKGLARGKDSLWERPHYKRMKLTTLPETEVKHGLGKGSLC